MKQDRDVRTLLLLCTFVLVFAGLYFARDIIAPATFAIFVVAGHCNALFRRQFPRCSRSWLLS
jgi:predicted PurR-regulated permease PerM